MEELKNIGFNYEKELADQSPKDIILGAGAEPLRGLGDPVAGLVGAVYAWPAPINGIYPRTSATINHAIDFINTESKPYLPIGTVQRGSQDWMNCATNAPHNEREKQSNYILEKELFSENLVEWLKEKGYINPDNGKFESSDAFNSILSGTNRHGNSLKAPIESIRVDGIIPKSMLPDDKSMDWDTYHNPLRITQEMKDLGHEFLERIELKYEKVYYDDFPKFTGQNKWEIFDSYVDRVDGDFIKRLAPDYNMMNYAYHLTINEIPQPESPKEEEIMKVEIDVVKQKNSPDFLFRGKKSGEYHRFGDENTFNEVVGDFPNEPKEMDIARSMISSPLYLGSSFMKVILNILSKLKGEK